jgi:DNA-directed RNA polymerase subunit RPC12/RpoP
MTRPSDTTHELVNRLLRGRREVAIGARAKRTRAVRTLIALGGLALIAGSWVLYRGLSSLAGPEHDDTVTLVLRCVECGADTVAAVRAADASRVAECPRCHARSAYKLWQCRTCNERFLPPAPEPGDAIRCPKCRGTQIGTASPP